MIKTAKPLLTAAMVASTLALSGCDLISGYQVEVPSGYIAKVKTKNGYQDEIKHISRFRLERCIWYCDSLVMLPINDREITESFTDVFMPGDDLKMSFGVSLIVSPRQDYYDFLYTKLPPQPTGETRIERLSMDTAYDTWAQPIIRTKLAEFVTQYTIDEIASNLGTINKELRETINASIEGSPFDVKYIAINPPQLPTMILTAKEKARERIETIKIEEGQMMVDAVRHQREMAEAENNRVLNNKKAQAEKEANDILSEAVSEQYVMKRMLDFMETAATSNNKMLIPVGMLDDMAGRIAAYNAMPLDKPQR